MKGMKLFAGALMIAACPAYAAPDKAGNAGQLVAEQFSEAAQVALTNLEEGFVSPGWCDKNDPDDLPYRNTLCQLNYTDIQNAIATTKLVALPSVYNIDPTGTIIQLAAKNFPDDKLIQISIDYWNNELGCELDRVALALHEYLGILKIEQDTYQDSSQLRDWLRVHGDGSLFQGCKFDAGGVPLPAPAPVQHWICNEAFKVMNKDGGLETFQTQGEGTSKFDAYNGLTADCRQKVSAYNQGQIFLIKRVADDACDSITPNDADLKCEAM